MNKLGKISLEEIFSSKGRTRIVKYLALNHESNISNIVKKTGLNHTSVNAHLSFLSNIGLLQEKQFGKIRIFRYKSEYLEAKAIKNLFELWEGKKND